MTKIIDEIVREVLDRKAVDDVTHMVIDKKSYKKLLNNYSDEFEIELIEFNRTASKEDLEDYLNVKIIVDKVNGGKFKFLKI